MQIREYTAGIDESDVNGTDFVDLSDSTLPREIVAALVVPVEYDQVSIGFEASFDGGTTWLPVIKTDGSALVYTCTGSTAEVIAVPPADLAGLKAVRPLAPGNVAAACVFTFITRPA